MKKKLVFFCLLVLFATAAFAKPIDFTLVNHTDDDITEIYFAPTTDDEWSDSLLAEGDPLLYRGSMEITFGEEYEERIKKEKLKLFDMLFVSGGDEYEIYDLELAKIKTLEVSLDKDGNPVAKLK